MKALISVVVLLYFTAELFAQNNIQQKDEGGFNLGASFGIQRQLIPSRGFYGAYLLPNGINFSLYLLQGTQIQPSLLDDSPFFSESAKIEAKSYGLTAHIPLGWTFSFITGIGVDTDTINVSIDSYASQPKALWNIRSKKWTISCGLGHNFLFFNRIKVNFYWARYGLIIMNTTKEKQNEYGLATVSQKKLLENAQQKSKKWLANAPLDFSVISIGWLF